MVRQKAPPPKQSANLTPEKIRQAIPLIEKRIGDLKAFDLAQIDDTGEPGVTALNTKIDDTLARVFGANTIEYDRYFSHIYCDTPVAFMGGSTSIHEIREGYKHTIDNAIAKLQTAKEMLAEQLEGVGENRETQIQSVFSGMQLQPQIAEAAGKLFENGHYANAVEDACKALDLLVQLKSMKNDLSGTALMQTVFSPDKPILLFNELKTDTDKSEQRGLMFLFAGAMQAIRNPRAHELIQDDPERALEFIGFISLLAKILEGAKRA